MGCAQLCTGVHSEHVYLPTLIGICPLKPYNHCCRQHCFAYKDSQRDVLFSLECNLSCCLIDIIMHYLPNDDPHRNVKYRSHHNVRYMNAMNTSDALCPVWSKHMMNRLNPTIRMVILGDSRVGKTSLVKRYTADTYTEAFHDPSMDEYEKRILINYEPYTFATLRISDFAGQEPLYSGRHVFRFVDDSILREGQIFLCCFAVDSQLSYQNALESRKRILQCKEEDQNWALILVATKCDLVNRSNPSTFVDTQQAMERAKKWNMGYIETSAKRNVNINSLFERSVYEYWTQSESHQCWDESLEESITPTY